MDNGHYRAPPLESEWVEAKRTIKCMKCYLKCLKKNVSKMSERIVALNVQMIVHVRECETLCVFMLTNLAFVSARFSKDDQEP